MGIFNAAAASWEKNPKLGFGGAATQIPTPIIGQYDGDGKYFDDDDDDYLHIMMYEVCACLFVSDEKWSLFQEDQVPPPGVSKNDHYLKKVSRIPVWVTKNEHFHNLDILDSCICVFQSDKSELSMGGPK